jgi:hypothetical protein
MELWSPPHDAPHLLEWWRPLILVSRRARAERFPWPVHIDEFRLAGRVKRQGRPDIWIYDHHENGGSVCVDATGQTYKFMATPRAKGPGQFRQCPVRTALWRARLPDVVQSVSYDPPRQGPWDEVDEGGPLAVAPESGDTALTGRGPSGRLDIGDEAAAEPAADDAEVDEPAAGTARVIRRGHLTLIAG